jgi:AcrR family transcriptional regulator
MTRLAHGRDTHLLPAEIAAEALRQFDEGSGEPSIRQLAAALGVAPSAIYHHFASRADIVAAAMVLVWDEVTLEVAQNTDDPFTDDPVEVLVISGLAVRHVFMRHFRIAPYMAATPQADMTRANTVALTASLFERMGLTGEEAAAPFHSYASYTLGASLFAATRTITNENLARDTDGEVVITPPPPPHPALAERSDPETWTAMDQIMDLSVSDPVRDERLYELGLRRLIATFAPGYTAQTTEHSAQV